jgi:hypothetical protein
MTDLEFEILDELYFLIPYSELKENVNMDDEALKRGLKTLVLKDWVRSYHDQDRLVEIESMNFDEDYQKFYYLASKKGLFAHNST